MFKQGNRADGSVGHHKEHGNGFSYKVQFADGDKHEGYDNCYKTAVERFIRNRLPLRKPRIDKLCWKQSFFIFKTLIAL